MIDEQWGSKYKTPVVNPIKVFGRNFIKIDVIQCKLLLVESIFDVIYAKIGF